MPIQQQTKKMEIQHKNMKIGNRRIILFEILLSLVNTYTYKTFEIP